MPRKYQLKQRAARQSETRQRIVEATVHLHETLGGTNTTISAIAERAGVERLTVYRHFPDQRSLFTACTSHYFSLNPPPDPAVWGNISVPEDRLRAGLKDIYAYHLQTERMFTRTAGDLQDIPVLREVLAPFFATWERIGEMLCSPWKVSGRSKAHLRALIGHAIAFQTWKSLVREQKLNEADAIDLLVRTARCISENR